MIYGTAEEEDEDDKQGDFAIAVRSFDSASRNPQSEIRNSSGPLAFEDFAGVGEVENREVQTFGRIAIVRRLELVFDFFGGGGGEVFDGADADAGLEDDDEHAMVVDGEGEHAEFFAVLVDAVEIGFVDEVGDGLVGHVGAGGERGDGGEIKLAIVTVLGDQKPALIDHQRRGGIALLLLVGNCVV